MNKKDKNAEKNKQLHMAREAKRESLTNWYMINLSFGILAMIVLLLWGNMYKQASTLKYANPLTWTFTGVFALAGLIVFILGKAKKIKNAKRANHYAIFLGVCALSSLWLSLYNKIRYFAENILARMYDGNTPFTINSHWNINVLFIGIAAYLIIGFIYYVIKLYKLR